MTQSIKKALPLWCSKCGHGEPDFNQVYGNTILIVYGNPTTVGQQSEINEKRAGKGKLDEMATSQQVARRKRFSGKLPKGASLSPHEDSETPWFRSGEVKGLPKRDKPLNLAKVKNVKKFIETGDL